MLCAKADISEQTIYESGIVRINEAKGDKLKLWGKVRDSFLNYGNVG